MNLNVYFVYKITRVKNFILFYHYSATICLKTYFIIDYCGFFSPGYTTNLGTKLNEAYEKICLTGTFKGWWTGYYKAYCEYLLVQNFFLDEIELFIEFFQLPVYLEDAGWLLRRYKYRNWPIDFILSFILKDGHINEALVKELAHYIKYDFKYSEFQNYRNILKTNLEGDDCNELIRNTLFEGNISNTNDINSKKLWAKDPEGLNTYLNEYLKLIIDYERVEFKKQTEQVRYECFTKNLFFYVFNKF